MLLSTTLSKENVINKNIIYLDTNMPINIENNNQELTIIDNVSEYSLETCIKIILETNSDILFNNIQYSRKDKKVYFYTNKKITITKWQENINIPHKELLTENEISEEIMKILTQKKPENSNCISIYEVSNLIKTTIQRLNDLKNYYTEVMNRKLKEKYPKTNINLHSFNYQNNELTICFEYKNGTYDKIVIKKENNNLYILKSKNKERDIEIIKLLYLELIGIINMMYEKNNFINDCKYNIYSINSNFLVNIDCFGVTIDTKKNSIQPIENSNSEYYFNYNFLKTIQNINEEDDVLFKQIYIKIDSCPEWSKLRLYYTRCQELLEEQKQIDRIKEQERKKEKRLQLIKKVFPFYK